MARHGYTIEDMCAIADARDCSYGVVQQHLEFGAPWPPLRHSVIWPEDSAHHGEMILGPDGEINAPAPAPAKKKASANHIQKRKKDGICTRCGASYPPAERTRVSMRHRWARHQFGSAIGDWCPSCAAALLPPERPKLDEIYPKFDDAGKKLDPRRTARCFRCGGFFTRADGGKIFSDTIETQHLMLAGYLCPDCLPGWQEEAKKSDAPN